MRSRILALVTFAGVLAIGGCGWTQYRGDSRHTGSNIFEHDISVANVGTLTPAWTNTNQDLARQEVVVRGGRAFVAAPLNFYAMKTKTGVVDWHVGRTKGTFGPATTDGGNGNGRVYPVERWTIVTGPLTGEQGGVVPVLDATSGTSLDSIPLGSSPPVFSGAWRYATINADIFPTTSLPIYHHRVDATAGSTSFSVDFPQSYINDLATDGDHVFAAANNFNSLAAIPRRGCGTTTCAPLWRSATLGEYFQSVSISGPTVFAQASAIVYAFPAAGCGQSQCSPLWRTPEPALGDPIAIAISGDRLYLTRGSKLEVYAAAGCGSAVCAPLWTSTITGMPTAPSVANGVVYAGSSDGTLFAWDAAGCGAATCPALVAGAQGGALGPVTIDDGSLYFTVGGALRKLVLPDPS